MIIVKQVMLMVQVVVVVVVNIHWIQWIQVAYKGVIRGQVLRSSLQKISGTGD